MGQKIQRDNSMAKLIETTKTLARVKSERQSLREKQKILNELIKQTPIKQSFSKKIRSDSLQQKSPENGFSSPLGISGGSRKIVEYQKNTMSTLFGSIKSSSSLRDRIEEKVPIFERVYEGKKSVIV